jgi:hypothetical protein
MEVAEDLGLESNLPDNIEYTSAPNGSDYEREELLLKLETSIK